MNIKQILATVAVLLAGAALAALILRTDPSISGDAEGGHGEQGEHGDHGDEEEGYVRGPHRGRLLTDGNFAVEVTIFERGVPPQFRAYLYDHDKPLSPSAATVSIELRRLGGRVGTFRFTPEGDYLRGDGVVEEPHSFDVTVIAEHQGATSRWTYESYEGRVQLPASAAAESGLVVEPAGSATLHTTLRVNGRIVPNEDRLTHVIPRYPGIVMDARKRLGDPVAKGEVLAVVQSNESLQPYTVTALISGTVIKKHVTPGEFASEGEDIYVVADLSTVWVDLDIYRQDFDELRIGQEVELAAGEGVPPARGKIAYISPFGAENTQTMLARVVLPNPTGEWRPGLFISGEVVIAEKTVPLAVRTAALQKLRDWDVVFVRDGELYEAQPVELGERDADWVEVTAGLAPGQEYVVANSFILKADIGKSGASHDH
jgi:cobalt-zinc-cadmium efflux system membrane fusion protein